MIIIYNKSMYYMMNMTWDETKYHIYITMYGINPCWNIMSNGTNLVYAVISSCLHHSWMVKLILVLIMVQFDYHINSISYLSIAIL